MSLTLAGGAVLASLDPPRVVEADVVVENGRVTAVGEAPSGGARRDCTGCLVVPGNVCAHTHLYSTLARGMPFAMEPPSDFLQILQRVWWRLDRALDEDSVRASTLAGGAAALLAGTTTVVDHHASPNAIDGALDVEAEALADLGLRSILCYEITDRDGPERAAAGVSENRRFAGRVAAGTFPLARAMVGAHASFTLSADSLDACVGAARDAGVGLHVHVAEDGTDGADALGRFGVGVVERLASAGALDDRALLAHCVRLDADEARAVNGSGALVAHNCRSNMNNAVGRAAVRRFARLALGTDGIDGDLFAESRAAYWRLREDDVLAGPDRVLGWLAAGASFAGAAFGEPGLGRIEAGAPADLVVLDYDPPTPLTGANAAGHWMFGVDAARVRDVLVAGEVVVRDRRLTRVDQDEVEARARAAAVALWERMEGIGAHPFAPAAAVAGGRS